MAVQDVPPEQDVWLLRTAKDFKIIACHLGRDNPDRLGLGIRTAGGGFAKTCPT